MGRSMGSHAGRKPYKGPTPRRKIGSRRECAICSDNIFQTQFPKQPHVHSQDGSEQHSSDVCFKCYGQHIEAEVDSKGPDSVSCPQCPHVLSEPEVRKLARRVGIYQKYMRSSFYHSLPF
jgi:hypothetical protein